MPTMCLNQPPSGGCVLKQSCVLKHLTENNQPPSGGCVLKHNVYRPHLRIQPSRLRAAVC